MAVSGGLAVLNSSSKTNPACSVKACLRSESRQKRTTRSVFGGQKVSVDYDSLEDFQRAWIYDSVIFVNYSVSRK